MDQHLRRIDSLWWGKAPLEKTYDLFLCNTAHGTHVPGNKTPLMCALCLAEGEKAAHAYIMGGKTILRWLSFFFFLTVRFICLLVENRCESLTMAALPTSIHHALSILLSWFTLSTRHSFTHNFNLLFYPLITFDMPPFFPLTAVSNKKCTCTIVSRTFKFWVLFNSRCPRFPMLRSPSCALWGHPE